MLQQRRTRFAVHVDGTPLKLWIAFNKDDITGPRPPRITHSSEYEMREAALFSQVPWMEFRALPYPERVGLIAFYRVQNAVEWVRTVYANLKGGK